MANQIFCGGPSVWATFVGWFQILLNVFTALLIFPAFAGFSGLGSLYKETDMGIFRSSSSGFVTEALIILSIGLLFSILGIVFGVILLQGVHQRRHSFLNWWLVFTTVLLVWTVIHSVIDPSSGQIVKIVQGVIGFLFYGLSIGIVATFKREIQIEVGAQISPKILINSNA